MLRYRFRRFWYHPSQPAVDNAFVYGQGVALLQVYSIVTSCGNFTVTSSNVQRPADPPGFSRDETWFFSRPKICARIVQVLP